MLGSLHLAASAPAGEPAIPSAERARPALVAAERALGHRPQATKSGGAQRPAPGAATAALRELAVALPALRGEPRARAKALLARPDQRGGREYFGPEAAASPRCDANLCVHWAARGRHAPDQAGSDGDGVPDYVEEVLAAAARSYEVENVALGWRPGKPDAGRGGDRRTDVYLTALQRRLFGYVAADSGQSSPRRSAFLVLDNDYAGFGRRGAPLDLMRATMAHEYNHVLQYAYTVHSEDWLYEATAVWAEEQVYPAIDDYLNFVPSFARRPEKPVSNKGKMYGSGVLSHWLAGRYGAAVVRGAWEQLGSVKPRFFSFAALDRAIGARGGASFSRELAAFAAATAEWRSSSAFPDAGRYPDIKRAGKLTAKRRKGSLDHTAYRLYAVRVRRGEAVRLAVKTKRGTRSAIALVGRDGPASGGEVTVARSYRGKGGALSVSLPDPRRYERITAVVVNADDRRRGGRFRSDGARYQAKVRKRR